MTLSKRVGSKLGGGQEGSMFKEMEIVCFDLHVNKKTAAVSKSYFC